MYRHFLNDLVWDGPLKLVAESEAQDRIISGSLKSATRTFSIVNGVPDFVGALAESEKQVLHVFSRYWETHSFDYDNAGKKRTYIDSLKKLFLVDEGDDEKAESAIHAFLHSKRRILDAGCGAGWVARFHRSQAEQQWYNVDFGESVFVAEKELHADRNSLVARASVFELPFKPSFFDLIFSIGVLHHTPDPKRAFLNLVTHLAPGGDICIAMIRKQSPIRDFTDSFIRKHTTEMSYEDNVRFAESVYLLSKELFEKGVSIRVPAGLEIAGFDKGEYPLQRFIHTHIMKCFYNPSFSEEENIMQQVDWYTTKFAWPYTEDELTSWYSEAGLTNIQLWHPKNSAEKNELIRIKGTRPL